MPRLERDVRRAEPARPGHGEQPERAGADDRDPVARSRAGEPERMPRHGRRLDDGGVAQVETRREGGPALGRDAELLGHAAVGD